MSKKPNPLRSAMMEMRRIEKLGALSGEFFADWKIPVDRRNEISIGAAGALSAIRELDPTAQVAALYLAISICREFVQERAEIQPQPGNFPP